MHAAMSTLRSRCYLAALLIFFFTSFITATAPRAQGPCTDDMIWAVFPTSKELGGVNDQLLTKSGPTVNQDGTRTFSMRWQGAAASRSVSVTITEYPDPAPASKKVHEYGFDDKKGQTKTGMIKLNFGDEGYKTDDIQRPYYLVHKGQFALSYYTSYPGRSGGIPGDQDPTVAKIIQKIAALPCLGATVTPPPPPPVNTCPKVSLNASPSTASPSQTIALTASATDPEGDALTLKWAIIDAQGKPLSVAWNGKAVTGGGQVQDTISWKNPSGGQYTISVSVSDGKCGKTETASTQVLVQAGMQVSVGTDKTTYSPGEAVVISGNVRDATGGLAGAALVVDIGGTKLSAITDTSGNYTCPFSIPASAMATSYKVVATASYTGYPDARQSMSFNVLHALQKLIVEIRPDKDHYLIGDTVYCSITVKDSNGVRIPSADLNIKAIRLGSGKAQVFTVWTDGLGEYPWRFIWGQRDGKPITEGKLQVKVTASKKGYSDGMNDVIILGCGDFEPSKEEDCFNCPEECKCAPGLICDPWSLYADAKGCSPKTACVIICPNLVTWIQWIKMAPWLEGIQKYYRKKGYKVFIERTTKVAENSDLPGILAGPSLKAIAYFGHADAPLLLGRSASELRTPVLQTLYHRLVKRGIENRKASEIARAYAKQLNLDYAYIATCYSLADTSLAHWLLHSGGIYWGERDRLFYLNELEEYERP